MAVITRDGIVLCDYLTFGNYTYTKGHHVEHSVVDAMWPYVCNISLSGRGSVLQSYNEIYIAAENGNTSQRNTILVENNSQNYPTQTNYLGIISGIVLISGCLYLFWKSR